MAVELIPIKKLNDSFIGDFYPLSADKGTIVTEDIPVSNNIGLYSEGDTIHEADVLHDILKKLVGGIDRHILKSSIDVNELTDDETRVPCSKLIKRIIQEIKESVDKHEFITQEEYDSRLIAGTIKDDVIYMTYSTTVKYTVVFKDWDGTVLKTQSVNKGGSATAPATPTRAGYIFNGWDKSFTNVQSDLVVTATYISATGDNAYLVYEDGEINIQFEDDDLVVTEDFVEEPLEGALVTEDKLKNILIEGKDKYLIPERISSNNTVLSVPSLTVNQKFTEEIDKQWDIDKDLFNPVDLENYFSNNKTEIDKTKEVTLTVPNSTQTIKSTKTVKSNIKKSGRKRKTVKK